MLMLESRGLNKSKRAPETRILAHSLPAHVAPCVACGFLPLNWGDILKVLVISLKFKRKIPWKQTHFAMKTKVTRIFKSFVCPPATCGIYGRPRSKILLFAIIIMCEFRGLVLYNRICPAGKESPCFFPGADIKKAKKGCRGLHFPARRPPRRPTGAPSAMRKMAKKLCNKTGSSNEYFLLNFLTTRNSFC